MSTTERDYGSRMSMAAGWQGWSHERTALRMCLVPSWFLSNSLPSTRFSVFRLRKDAEAIGAIDAPERFGKGRQKADAGAVAVVYAFVLAAARLARHQVAETASARRRRRGTRQLQCLGELCTSEYFAAGKSSPSNTTGDLGFWRDPSRSRQFHSLYVERGTA
jgi:hypothetical protein